MTVSNKQAAEHQIKLKIADIIIELKSQFKMEPLTGKYDWRYTNFIYKGYKQSDIILDIEIKANPPLLRSSKRIFTTIHPLDHKTNWSLFQKGDEFAIKQHISQKRQYAILNKDFSKGIVYLSADKKIIAWKLDDIIYDILQIILINYLSQEKGIFVHSIGLKDIDKKGLLFAGPTQSGKSTTAKLWYRHSRAQILNDDRIVIRKLKNRLYIYGTPWHGDFSDYLKSSADRAKLKSIFFIYHNSRNKIDYLNPKEAFKLLYPNIFPVFWNKESLEKQINLCHNLINLIPSYRLGFKNDKSVISAVRSIR